MKNNDFELTSEQTINEVRSWQTTEGGEGEIVGAIFDQDQAQAFLEWLCSPEAREIGQRLRRSGEAG